MKAFGAVVCADEKIVAHPGHFFFVDEKVSVLCTYDHIHGSASLVEPFRLRVYRGSAHTPCYEDIALRLDFFRTHTDKLGRQSQRSYNIGETVTYFPGDNFPAGHANLLSNDGH